MPSSYGTRCVTHRVPARLDCRKRGRDASGVTPKTSSCNACPASPSFCVAGAGERAFGLWAARFAAQQLALLSARRWRATQAAVATLLLPAGLAALFAAAGSLLRPAGPSALHLGGWVAFRAAFGRLSAGLAGLVGAATRMLAVLPAYERARADPPGSARVRHAAGRRTAGAPRRDRVHFRHLRLRPRHAARPAGPDAQHPAIRFAARSHGGSSGGGFPRLPARRGSRKRRPSLPVAPRLPPASFRMRFRRAKSISTFLHCRLNVANASVSLSDPSRAFMRT